MSASPRQRQGAVRQKGFGRRLGWRLEAALFHGWLRLCGALSPEAASNLGGWIARTLGPRVGASTRARANLRRALPALSPATALSPAPAFSQAEETRILRAMWDNLGRVAGEYAHLDTITAPDSGRVETEGFHHLDAAFAGQRGTIAFSGHLANWEVMHIMVARRAARCTTVVRDPNNPLIHDALERCRAVGGGRRSPKGTAGARDMLATLRGGGLVAMLVDQRMREGVTAPFFGIEAPSPAAPAQMALRLGAALHPVNLERTGPARFRMTVHPALDLAASSLESEDHAARVRAVTAAVNAWVESFIRARPEDWLWLHRRWGKDETG